MSTPVSKDNLEGFREQINELDKQLVTVLENRGRIAQKIAQVKSREGLSVFDAAREEQVLARVTSRLPEKSSVLSETAMRTIFQAIMRECRAVQAENRIALLGPAGSFTHLAATGYFGAGQNYSFARTIGDAIDQLASQDTGSCVAPIENSFGGVVGETLDMLWEKEVHVAAQLHMKIHHHLIASQNIDQLKVIRSHRQVLHQCHRWLRQHAPNAELEETSSSSHAVSLAAEDASAGAIGSSLAATLYSLPIQERNIHDDPDNETRFFVLQSGLPAGVPDQNSSGEPGTHTGDLAAVLFTLQHKSGSLVDALQVFARNKINLKHIVSRPVRTASWEYVFEVELELPEGIHLESLLQQLSEHTIYMRSLGTYPALMIEGS